SSSCCVLHESCLFFLFLLLPRPPPSTLFPYTTLFRSLFEEAGFEGALGSGRPRQSRLPRGPVWNVPTSDRGRDTPVAMLDSSNRDRKSTRLNSSHVKISYAVFCLKKKINKRHIADHVL